MPATAATDYNHTTSKNATTAATTTQEPDLALLVPPSRCRPHARYEARPRKSRPPEKTYRMATNNRATLMAVDRGPSTVKANIVGVSGLLDLRRL
jgi:hypothetical protein